MEQDNHLFEVAGHEFLPVMPQLARVRQAGTTIGFFPFIIASAVAGYFLSGVWSVILLTISALFLLLYVVKMIIIHRQVRAIGYFEGETELYLRSGIMFRSMTVIPYGRMQFVDLSEGPVDRFYGMASVKLHTASASTDATIDGLPRAEAERLRRVLSARGESMMAGI